LLARRSRMSDPSAAPRQCQTSCALCPETPQSHSGRSPLPARASAAAVPSHVHHCSSLRCTLRTNDSGALEVICIVTNRHPYLAKEGNCHGGRRCQPRAADLHRCLRRQRLPPVRQPLGAETTVRLLPAARPCACMGNSLVGTRMQQAHATAQSEAHPLPADLSCHRARHTGCTARGHLHSRTSPPPPWSPPPSRHTQHASCTAQDEQTFNLVRSKTQGHPRLFGCRRWHLCHPCCSSDPGTSAAGLPVRP
jgi:hypothetical protein